MHVLAPYYRQTWMNSGVSFCMSVLVTVLEEILVTNAVQRAICSTFFEPWSHEAAIP